VTRRPSARSAPPPSAAVCTVPAPRPDVLPTSSGSGPGRRSPPRGRAAWSASSAASPGQVGRGRDPGGGHRRRPDREGPGLPPPSVSDLYAFGGRVRRTAGDRPACSGQLGSAGSSALFTHPGDPAPGYGPPRSRGGRTSRWTSPAPRERSEPRSRRRVRRDRVRGFRRGGRRSPAIARVATRGRGRREASQMPSPKKARAGEDRDEPRTRGTRSRSGSWRSGRPDPARRGLAEAPERPRSPRRQASPARARNETRQAVPR
jgi:hypothetical protein